ncbi:MAG: hypothetical protein KBA26_10530 [Candidatus Delongbacteria bacterium]|nr:hypothetical protein [Candidatus Delongbacteria bacterium]
MKHYLFNLLIIMCLVFLFCGKSQKDSNSPQQATIKPLSDFKMQINLKTQIEQLKANDTTLLTVSITNTGTETWNPADGIHPYYYILKNDDKPAKSGSVYFTNIIQPGQSIDMEIKILPAIEPGDYRLQISMVQENIGFFDKNGAQPILIPIKIVP